MPLTSRAKATRPLDERPSNNFACITARLPSKISNQMGPTLR
jgi:hypothetical protein